MGIFNMFGGGRKRILAQGERTQGTVTKAAACRWLKVNRKPVRIHVLDGAAFPHIIPFRYWVNDRGYAGTAYVNWNVRCPEVGEKITVFFDREDPAQYAVKL